MDLLAKLIFEGKSYDINEGVLKELLRENHLDSKIVGGSVGKTLVDLFHTVEKDEVIDLFTMEDPKSAGLYRHTMSHVMAQAIKRLYKDAKFAIGPTIENGFYYDIDVDVPLNEEELKKIETEMKQIIKENLSLEKITMSSDEAIKYFESQNQPYKVEIIKDIGDSSVTLYKQGEFVDLCRGPHLPSTGMVKNFKLLNVAGAYWRGDEKNKMLQRIYGTAFYKKEDLEGYLKMLEEAEKRDHRKLGPQLDLFSIHSDVAPGMVFFHPKGTTIRRELEKYWREEHKKANYVEVVTPMVMNEALWRQSGHWDHYRENMYFTEKENQMYAIKPMNCPGHIMIYKSQTKSYKDLPLRMCELGTVHRYERSGVVHGLFRTRAFTQDDAHIFCTQEQIEDEIKGVISLVDKTYKLFGFPYKVELSTRPENSMGSDEIWEISTNALKNALDHVGLEYQINEGDGAFYGPKIDFHVRDSIGRTWQCATIQLDFLMPERFEISYVGPDNLEHRPVMIHRVIYGSIERFIGILIEHYAGAFPAWIAPIQVMLLPISDKHLKYSRNVLRMLDENGIRVEIDDKPRKISYKIREAQLQKIPYMLVIGDKEVENESVAVRLRSGKDLGDLKVDEFISRISEEIKSRSQNSIYGE
ncbi:MAG: threonine--tRNA ligase [Thermotogae bacterium]|nr:threonine--tRNA ligase [Thermotogota bacterium]